ncbi:putative NTD biosynthesis operon protein NtdA [Streptomyces afghaniensis 772] [Streptomyces afghaniensis]
MTGAGQYSDAAALSFNPAQVTSAAARLLTTGRPRSPSAAGRLQDHGFEPGRKNFKRSLNARIDNTMAAIGWRGPGPVCADCGAPISPGRGLNARPRLAEEGAPKRPPSSRPLLDPVPRACRRRGWPATPAEPSRWESDVDYPVLSTGRSYRCR